VIGKLKLWWPKPPFQLRLKVSLFLKTQFQTSAEFCYLLHNNAMLMS